MGFTCFVAGGVVELIIDIFFNFFGRFYNVASTE
jgi:hypothetical protein